MKIAKIKRSKLPALKITIAKAGTTSVSVKSLLPDDPLLISSCPTQHPISKQINVRETSRKIFFLFVRVKTRYVFSEFDKIASIASALE